MLASGIKSVVAAGHADPFKNLTLQGKLFKSETVIEMRPILKMAGNHELARFKPESAVPGRRK